MLLPRTKFYWSCAGGPVLIMMTGVVWTFRTTASDYSYGNIIHTFPVMAKDIS